MNKDQKRQELEAIQAELLAIKEELNTAEAAEDLLAELEAVNMILSSFWAANDFDPAPKLRKIIDASKHPQKIKDALYKLFDHPNFTEGMETQLNEILSAIDLFLNKESLATYNVKLKYQAILNFLGGMNLHTKRYKRLDIAFEIKLKELLASKLTVEESPQQYSLNIKKWEYLNNDLWEISSSASVEFSADKNDVLLYQSDKGDELPDYAIALFKNSVSLKLDNIINKDIAAAFTTTIFNSSGPIADLTNLLETHFGPFFPGIKLMWTFKSGVISGGNPFREDNKLVVPKIAIGVTLARFQLKLVIDNTKTFKELIGDPKFPIEKLGNIDFNFSISLKWTPEFLERLNKQILKKQTKVKPNLKDEISQAEQKVLQEIDNDAKKINSKVDKIADNLDSKKISTDVITKRDLDKKNLELSKDVHEGLKKMQQSVGKLNSKGSKTAANNIIKKTGSHIVTKLGGRLAGKVILKFIPGLNVISTIADVIELGTLLFSFFSTPQFYYTPPIDKNEIRIDTMDDI